MVLALGSSIEKDPHRNVDQFPINFGNELDPRLPLKHNFGAQSSRTSNAFFQKMAGLLKELCYALR